MMLVTSHREVIAAFKARSLFQVMILEIFCNICTENLENNAFENTETFVIMAGCVTFCFDCCFVKCFPQGSSAIIPY